MQIEPHIISYFCAKHLVTIEMNEELLKRKLELLLSNGVAGINILRDLHVVERSEISLIKRFELLKECKVERIMPWMLKCENETFYRYEKCQFLRTFFFFVVSINGIEFNAFNIIYFSLIAMYFSYADH